MSQFQNIVAAKLGQTPLTTTLTTLYVSTVGGTTTTSVNSQIATQTYMKSIDICNTTAGAITVNVGLVPNGITGLTTATLTPYAIYYGYTVAANSIVQWRGLQILNPGDSIQVSASTTGCTITISGAKAT
jgi:hypothetical protein